MSTLEEKLRELHDGIEDGGEGCVGYTNRKLCLHDCGDMDALRAAAALALEEAAQVADKACNGPWDYDTKGPYAIAQTIRELARRCRDGNA